MLCGGPRKGATVTDFLTNDEISLLRSLEKKSRTITGNLTHKRYDRLATKGYIKLIAIPEHAAHAVRHNRRREGRAEGYGWRRGLK